MAAKPGNKHHMAKLTAAKVKQARKSYEVRDKKTGKRKWSAGKLAEKYGVSRTAMRLALIGETWKHV
jgi:DNA-binding FadR family transcriptional regulator